MKKIAIVILHFINKEQTAECLASVGKLDAQGLKIETFVVNNNPQEDLNSLKNEASRPTLCGAVSSPPSWSKILPKSRLSGTKEDEFNDFFLLNTGQNLGFASGNNLGIKKALKNNPDFIFIINNDTILDKKILIELIKAAGLNSKTGIFGPKIYFAPGYEFHKERYKKEDQGKVIWYTGGVIDWQNIVASHRGVDEVDHGQYDTSLEMDFVSGCAIFVKKEVFEKIGLFDERFFLYWEDVDLCQRAKIAGFKVVFIPQAKLWHANAGSSQVGGPLHDYYITRNRMLFGMKYAKLKTRLALIRESLKILFQGRQWQRVAIRDFYLRKFGQGSFRNLKMIE